MAKKKSFTGFGAVAACFYSVLALSAAAHAEDLFRVTVTVPQQTGVSSAVTQSATFNNVSDFATVDYKNITDAYTDTRAANASLFIRGIPANAAYAANSAALSFSVPSLGITQTFNGATRKDSANLFEDYLKKNASTLLRALTAKSAIDPIAGNPNSLMSSMGVSDFSQATGITPAPGASSGRQPGVVGLGIDYGRFKAAGYNQNVYNLPLSYSFGIGSSGYAIQLSMPLSYMDVQGAKSYSGSLGVGLRIPVGEGWSLTPAVRAGAAGSMDLGAGSALYSASLTSSYATRVSGLDVKIGNMAAYYKSQAITAGDVNIDYNLKNYTFRNGVSIGDELPFELMGGKTSWQAFAIDTYTGGDSLYIKHYADVGVALGVPVSTGGITYDQFRLGLTYSFAIGGGDYKGIRANFGYKF